MRRLGLLLLLLPLVGGCVRRGRVALAPPKVFRYEASRASLALQGARIVEAMRHPPALTDATGRRGAEDESVAGAAEQVEDLAQREAAVESLRLMMEGDARAQRPGARLFLLRWEVWIEPESQPCLSECVRCLDPWHGTRDLRSDYDLEMRFAIPMVGDDPSDPLVQVYGVFPSVARDDIVESLAGRADRGSGRLGRDHGRELRAARRHPRTRSFVDGPRRFRVVFAPRAREVRRGWWWYLCPITSRTETIREFEPGPRSITVALLVRDADALRDELRGQRFLSARRDILLAEAGRRPRYSLELGALELGYVGLEVEGSGDEAQVYESYGVTLSRGGDAGRKVAGGTSVVYDEGADALRLPLVVSAAWRPLDRPTVGYTAPFEGSSPPRPVRLPFTDEVIDDEVRDIRVAAADLPLGTERLEATLAVVDSSTRLADHISATPRLRWRDARAGRDEDLRHATLELYVLDDKGVLRLSEAQPSIRPEVAGEDGHTELRLSPYPPRLEGRAREASEGQPAATGPYYIKARIGGRVAWSRPLWYIGPLR